MSDLQCPTRLFLARHGEAEYVIAGETNLMEFAELSNVDKLRRLFDAFTSKRDIEALNRSASIHLVLHGEVDPALLTGLGLASARAGEQTLLVARSGEEARGASDRRVGLDDPVFQHVKRWALPPADWPASETQ